MAKWQVDKMTSWWIGKFMKQRIWLGEQWLYDEMTSWHNGKMMKRQVDQMTSDETANW